jgi:RNA polymerase sigma factor (TIGR02999 family)
LPKTEVTRVLDDLAGGDPSAAGRLLPLLYDELRKLAADRLAREKPGHTLEPTALVHEAFLRLVGPDGQGHFASRNHFFGAAAEAMRRILVESARRKHRLRRGGGWRRVDLTDQPSPAPDEAVLALDDALCLLAREDPIAARVVELRQFAGLSHQQIADVLGVSIYQARQKWTYARAWLRVALEK